MRTPDSVVNSIRCLMSFEVESYSINCLMGLEAFTVCSDRLSNYTNFSGNVVRMKSIPFGFCACWYVEILMIDLEWTTACLR
jgi:hypothetical protein